MRLPLAHPPPGEPARPRLCAYLTELAQSSVGLPLSLAAQRLLGPGGRGRHGNALQWHLGLDVRDSRPGLDWEDRIEIKLVSVWRRGDGTWSCDKLKVCDHGVDPWHKLSNVLWVLADRMTRVVLGHRFSVLEGDLFAAMHRAWGADPHFGRPDLFVESRDAGSSMSPAYYLSAAVMRAWVVEPVARQQDVAPLAWDSSTSGRALAPPPRWVLIDEDTGSLQCPCCQGALGIEDLAGVDRGWLKLVHPRNGRDCASFVWRGVDGAHIPRSPVFSRSEQARMLAGDAPDLPLWRLSDRCPEPEDHGHA